MKPMKIAVLGGTGFVGRHLVTRLHELGHRITVLSRNRERQRDLLVLPRVQVRNYTPGDDAELSAELSGHQVVINLVGILNQWGPGGGEFKRAHVELTQHLVGVMKRLGIRRLLQMSALNAGKGDSHYLKTRGAAESVVKSSGLDWTLFQPSVIFGPGDGLFNRFAGLLKLFPVVPLARAQARFQPVYVGDVVEAMVRCLERSDSIGQTYQLGGPQIVTLHEVVDYTALVLGLKRVVVPLPDLFGRLQGWAFDWLPLPLKVYSTDNFLSLKLDSVVKSDGLRELGIDPTPFQPIVPTYLVGQHGPQAQLDAFRREARR